MTPDELKQYCAKGKMRFDIDQSWNYKGYSYATDGKMMIRIPTTEPDTLDGKFPENVDTEFNWLAPVSIVETENLKRVECPTCHGYGLPILKCDACDGRGEHYCSRCEDAHDCANCQGTGDYPDHDSTAKCPDCNGNKGGFNKRVGNRIIAYFYINKIQRLPNVRYQTCGKPEDAMRFTFDGGEGIIMPLTSE